MTAVNIVAAPEFALVCTDALWTEGEQIHWAGSKVIAFPHMHAAVIPTGPAHASIIVRDYVGGTLGTFDELVDTMVRQVILALKEHAKWWRRVVRQPFDIHAVGWSDREGRFTAWSLHYDGRSSPTLQQAGVLILQPGGPEYIDAMRAGGVEPEDVADAPARLPEVMRFQRETGALAGVRIGGFQELTTLTRAAITSQVVERWPETMGWAA